MIAPWSQFWQAYDWDVWLATGSIVFEEDWPVRPRYRTLTEEAYGPNGSFSRVLNLPRDMYFTTSQAHVIESTTCGGYDESALGVSTLNKTTRLDSRLVEVIEYRDNGGTLLGQSTATFSDEILLQEQMEKAKEMLDSLHPTGTLKDVSTFINHNDGLTVKWCFPTEFPDFGPDVYRLSKITLLAVGETSGGVWDGVAWAGDVDMWALGSGIPADDARYGNQIWAATGWVTYPAQYNVDITPDNNLIQRDLSQWAVGEDDPGAYLPTFEAVAGKSCQSFPHGMSCSLDVPRGSVNFGLDPASWYQQEPMCGGMELAPGWFDIDGKTVHEYAAGTIINAGDALSDYGLMAFFEHYLGPTDCCPP